MRLYNRIWTFSCKAELFINLRENKKKPGPEDVSNNMV